MLDAEEFNKQYEDRNYLAVIERQKGEIGLLKQELAKLEKEMKPYREDLDFRTKEVAHLKSLLAVQFKSAKGALKFLKNLLKENELYD